MKIKRTKILISLIFAVSVIALFCVRSNVLAATFTVDTTSDTADSNVGDAVCDDGAGNCTLRAAIQETEAVSGADTINFAIPGSGPHTIAPTTNYPNITDTVYIHGESQPGSSCGNLVPNLPAASNTPHVLNIVIDGTNAGGAVFDLNSANPSSNASGSVFKGLDIVHIGFFGAIAVRPDSGAVANNVQINCNYFGVNTDGSTTNSSGTALYVYGVTGADISNNLISGNASVGANINGNNDFHNNLVGVDSSGKVAVPNDNGVLVGPGAQIHHNVISGNTKGLVDFSSGTTRANFIGLGIDGSKVPNVDFGIQMIGIDSIVGDGTSAGRNYISANNGPGIWIYSEENNGDGCSNHTTSGNKIAGNYIGTDADGNVSPGYGNETGVVISSRTMQSCEARNTDNIIGGPNAGDGNVIAGNNKQGVLIFDDQAHNSFAKNNAVIGNSIYGNGGLGIDLAQDQDRDGVADSFLGPNQINNYVLSGSVFANHFVNYPVIHFASSNNHQVKVQYSYSANSAGTDSIVGYRLDFYLNQEMDKSGYGQGKVHLGSFIVNGSESNAEHTFTSSNEITGTNFITATATVLYEMPQ